MSEERVVVAETKKKKNFFSGYISTSKSPKVALLPEFGGDVGSYVYVVKPDYRRSIDVNRVLKSKSPFPYEMEVAIKKRVPADMVMGAMQTGRFGQLTGGFIKNPKHTVPAIAESIDSITDAAKQVLHGTNRDIKPFLPIWAVQSSSSLKDTATIDTQTNGNNSDGEIIPNSIVKSR